MVVADKVRDRVSRTLLQGHASISENNNMFRFPNQTVINETHHRHVVRVERHSR